MTAPDPVAHGWWLAGRASGIVALALVTLSVAVGLAVAGRGSRRPGMAACLRALHEHAALLALVSIAVHGLTLLGDRWLHPGLAGIAVPFQMAYRPLATGAGIVAGYLAAALGLSYYARRRIGAKRWKRLHRLTIAVYAMSVAHAVGAGTDGGGIVMRAAVAGTAAPIAALFAWRVHAARRRARTRPRPAAAGAPRAARTAPSRRIEPEREAA